MFKFELNKLSKIGYALGVIYCVYFNYVRENYTETINAFFYSIPFIIFASFVSLGISKVRKDKKSGIYFCVIILLMSL